MVLATIGAMNFDIGCCARRSAGTASPGSEAGAHSFSPGPAKVQESSTPEMVLAERDALDRVGSRAGWTLPRRDFPPRTERREARPRDQILCFRKR